VSQLFISFFKFVKYTQKEKCIHKWCNHNLKRHFKYKFVVKKRDKIVNGKSVVSHY